METAYHLHYILSRRYGPEAIKVQFVNLSEPPPEGDLGRIVQTVTSTYYEEPVLVLNNSIIAQGYIHPFTLFEIIEGQGISPKE